MLYMCEANVAAWPGKSGASLMFVVDDRMKLSSFVT